MQLGGQGHNPSSILPEKNACVLYRKLCEPMDVPYSYGEEKIFFPDGPFCRIDLENKRRILNLWMETNGLD